jgi:hypothetical protein
MAKAKKHVMSKEELRAPDEVQVVLRGFWEKLYNYRKLVLAGVGVLIALGVAIWIIGNTKRAGIEDRSDALREALAPVGASIGPEPARDPKIANLPRPARFENEGARVAAASAELEKYLAEHPEAAVARLVQITAANAKLNLGDPAGALAEVDAWLAAHPNSIARPVALELKARAQVAAEKKEEAKATLEALSQMVGPGSLRAAALVDLGDLENPVLNEGAGDPAKARTAYEAALASLPPEIDKDQPQMITGKPGLRGQIENHLGLLP